MPHPRLIIVAIGITACFALFPATVASAAPAGAVDSPPVLEVPYGEPNTVYSELYPVFVGPDTEEFVLEPVNDSAGENVSCYYSYGYGHPARATYTAAEWDAGGVLFPITAGRVEPLDSYGILCSTPSTTLLESWYIFSIAHAGTSVIASHEGLVGVTQTYVDPDPSKPVTIQPGQKVRVIGSPGTFAVPVPGQPTASGGVLSQTNLPAKAFVTDFVVAADGSSVTLTIPGADELEGIDADALFTLDFSVYAATNATTAVHTGWSTSADLVIASPSTTNVSLPLPIGVSFFRSQATATVTSAADGTPNGTVEFHVNGRNVGSVVLTDASKGRATIKLPYLKRGKYVVTASFAGSAAVGPSVSSPAPLRILF